MTSGAVDIDLGEIMRWLPHRSPFLLLDRASNFVKKTSLTGHKLLTEDEVWFAGHFPGNPIMPGVLLVEAMAQTGALLAAKSWDIDPTKATIVFSTVTKARFRSIVRPKSNLEIPVMISGRKHNFIQFGASILVDKKTVASCDFMATLVEVA